jgi:hypothetical protein
MAIVSDGISGVVVAPPAAEVPTAGAVTLALNLVCGAAEADPGIVEVDNETRTVVLKTVEVSASELPTDMDNLGMVGAEKAVTVVGGRALALLDPEEDEEISSGRVPPIAPAAGAEVTFIRGETLPREPELSAKAVAVADVDAERMALPGMSPMRDSVIVTVEVISVVKSASAVSEVAMSARVMGVGNVNGAKVSVLTIAPSVKVRRMGVVGNVNGTKVSVPTIVPSVKVRRVGRISGPESGKDDVWNSTEKGEGTGVDAEEP